MNRRRFLNLMFSSMVSFSIPQISWASFSDIINGKKKFHKSMRLMGTDVSVIIYHESDHHANFIIDKMFNLAISLITVFNRHDPHSALSFLNDNGYVKNPPPEMTYVLKKSLYFQNITGNTFDIRVNSIINCLEKNMDLREISDRFDKLRKLNNNILTFEGKNIYLGKDVESINLDGIAKGYIVDRMVEFASENGIKNCLVNAGGDIRAAGGLPDGKKWDIYLYNPIKKDIENNRISIRDGGIATSGIYFKQYNYGFNHIIDIRNNNSPKHHVSVTVISKNARTSDALATACTILDTQTSLNLISKFGKGLIITKHGDIISNIQQT